MKVSGLDRTYLSSPRSHSTRSSRKANRQHTPKRTPAVFARSSAQRDRSQTQQGKDVVGEDVEYKDSLSDIAFIAMCRYSLLPIFV